MAVGLGIGLAARHVLATDDRDNAMTAFERGLISEALERSGGRRGQAAELLGIDPRNLSYYLKKHDLQSGARG